MLRFSAFAAAPKRAPRAGFTLIELLVVVLIIGILAAVAVPQYQAAVLKSKTAELMTGARSLQQAQDRYFMANGKYASSFKELDIQMQGEETVWDEDSVRLVSPNGNMYFLYESFSEGALPGVIGFTYYYTAAGAEHTARCYAVESNKAANQACQSSGGKPLSSGVGCNFGLGEKCNIYVLW